MKSKYIARSLGFILTGLACVAGLASVAARVNAQSCTTQYGGTTTCVPTDLTINKQVAQPVTDSKGGVTASTTFVENLGVNQAFTPGADVLFRLTVKNASADTLNPVTVKDVLPAYLAFVSGQGSYDAGSRTLTITLDNMGAGESRTVEILTKVVDATQFPANPDSIGANQNVFCTTNYAEARALDRFDDDTAQLCFQPAQNLPVAGYNDLLLLLPFAGVGLSGLVLLKTKRSLP